MQAGIKRVAAAAVILVIWAAITVNSWRDWSGPKRPLEETVNAGFAWQIFFAGLFLAVMLVVFRWRDVGLTLPRPGTLRLLWLPALFIVVFLGAALRLACRRRRYWALS